MTDQDREMWERIVQIERERVLAAPPPPAAPRVRPTIHYTELPEDKSGKSGSIEWNFYRRVIGRLLAEGHEGRWVLIEGEEIIGIWDTEDEARLAAARTYPNQPLLVQQLLTRFPLLRTSTFLYRCQH